MKPILSLLTIAALTSTLIAGGFQGTSQTRGNASQLLLCDSNSSIVETMPIYTLSYEQQTTLEFMYQEEKMARDVYLTFYNMYGINIFKNISNSEQRHMDAVKTLLTKYSLDVALDEENIGEFVSIELQELYAQLIAQGQQSLDEALLVGKTIEVVDIEDLVTAIAEANPDAEIIFNQLKLGSENHLSAFTRLIDGDSNSSRGSNRRR